MLIDYTRITDPEYFSSVIDDLKEHTDVDTLTNELKMLAFKIPAGEVQPAEAEMIKGAINTRIKELVHNRSKNEHSQFENGSNVLNEHFNSLDGISDSNGDADYSNEYDRQKENDSGGRKMVLSPTSVSNHNGAISIVLIIAGVAITSVMYTLLWVASITK